MSTHDNKQSLPAEPAESRPLTYAAQYVRMSTEHQQYSTANQEEVIQTYAANRGFEIVRTYADEGKSGLSVSGRNSLKRLIADVTCGASDFKAILVYDVSRWGRFQDADESAYYEYLCKQAGITVHYCAEQFENDGRPTSTIIKSVKRAMAGEYSRELSSKVFQGQCRLIELGYRQGGAPGFGLRRMLIDQTGVEKGQLKQGEQKSLQTDRVILVPGPAEEVKTVGWMYQQFVYQGKSETEIAEALNLKGLTTDLGRPWTRGTVRQILTNEKYIGNNVYNRTSFKLKQKHMLNAPDIWVRKDGAFQAVVSEELFYTARGIVQERNRRYSDQELIEMLRRLAGQHESISAATIDAAEGIPPAASYRSRFGSLLAAYRLANCLPDRDYEYIETNRRLRQKWPTVRSDVERRLQAVGATVAEDQGTGYLMVNGEYSASVVLSRCRKTRGGSLRWQASFNRALAPDITILARMDSSNTIPSDYYFLPIMDIESPRLLLCEQNGAYLDTYQFNSLDQFASLASRNRIEVAA